MPVLRHVEADDSAIGAARDNHRKLFREANEGLQDGRARTDGGPSGSESRLFMDRRLSLAIITEAAGLQNAGIADITSRCFELGATCGRNKICDVHTLIPDEG